MEAIGSLIVCGSYRSMREKGPLLTSDIFFSRS